MDEESAARELARSYLRRRAFWTALVVGIGLVPVVGGCGEFVRSTSESDKLVHTGVHATASIDAAVNYHGRGGPFAPHLDVTYKTPGRLESRVRVWLPEDTDYRAGQKVEIVYDRKDPRRAVLAHGGDPGPLTLASFLVFLIGGIVVGGLLWIRRRMTRAARRVLGEPPARRSVSTSVEQVSPLWKQRHLYVDGDVFPAMTTKHGWHLPDGDARDLLVFGGRADGGVLVVDVPSGSVAFGYTGFGS